jgi:hypothetical protein
LGLLRWIANQRRWRQEHVAAFEAVSQLRPDGLTAFQHQALDAVARFVSADTFKHVPMEQEPGVYLLAPLGASGFELYIYPNEASIFGRKPHAWLEEWDYKTPDELLTALADECARRLSAADGTG